MSINWLACEMSANVHFSVVRGATECCPILLCIHQCCYSVTKLCDSKESPHRIHYARFPCPSPSPGVCSLLSTDAIQPSHLLSPFSSCLQSFPTSGSFPMSQLFASGGPNWIFNFSISPSNEYLGLISFKIDWFGLLVPSD